MSRCQLRTDQCRSLIFGAKHRRTYCDALQLTVVDCFTLFSQRLASSWKRQFLAPSYETRREKRMNEFTDLQRTYRPSVQRLDTWVHVSHPQCRRLFETALLLLDIVQRFTVRFSGIAEYVVSAAALQLLRIGVVFGSSLSCSLFVRFRP